VNSNGSITVTNISAIHNYGNGADLYTRGLTSVHPVTLNGINNFNWNGDDTTSESGLIVNADGTITVNKITASYNSWQGANLDNFTNWNFNGFASPGSVKVNYFGVFVGNINDIGLQIESNASVTINRVIAFDNGYRGVSIGLDSPLSVTNVTIVCSYASGNGGNQVDVDASGNLTVKGLLYFGVSDLSVLGTETITTCP
jgi:hypothetical protein